MEEYQEIIMAEFMQDMDSVMDAALDDVIIGLLPSGRTSPLADKLYSIKVGKDTYAIVADSPVFSILNDGSGIYNSEHAGAGPGGRIIPLKAKALHFKNAQLAVALGFPTEDVFLQSVKGIHPKLAIERTFETSRFQEIVDRFKR